MSSHILYIQNKHRTSANPHKLSQLEDFDYLEGEIIDLKPIIKNPNISLYCLDPENQRAIFVETPLDIDIYQAPFLYQSQYEHAQKLIAVPFSELPQLLEYIEPIKNLVIIYSVARSGSTLLSQIFNQVNTVLSLSEPDVFYQIVGMRNPDGSNDHEIAALLKFCLDFISKPTSTHPQSHCVIKCRCFGIELGDLIYHLVPNAKVIFLYRHLEDVIKSSIRAFSYLGSLLPTIQQNIDLYRPLIPFLKNYASEIDFTDPNAINFFIIMWLSVMESYLKLYQKNRVNFAIRYEDLVTYKEPMVTAIFQYCNLPLSEVPHACSAFNQDAQKGSNLSRESIRHRQINEPNLSEIRQKISKLLEKHPDIKTPDLILPGTFAPTATNLR